MLLICQNVRDHICFAFQLLLEALCICPISIIQGLPDPAPLLQSPSLLPASHTRHLSNRDHDGDDDGDDGDGDGGDGGDGGDDDGGDWDDDNFEDQGSLC